MAFSWGANLWTGEGMGGAGLGRCLSSEVPGRFSAEQMQGVFEGTSGVKYSSQGPALIVCQFFICSTKHRITSELPWLARYIPAVQHGFTQRFREVHET